MKTKTEAYLKIEAFRDAKNPGKDRQDAEDLSCVAYRYVNESGRPAAVFYKGKQRKCRRHICYGSIEKREEDIEKYFAECKAEERAQRVLKVGDVLVSSWGYEQTNIDFYEVVRLAGQYSVFIREIGSEAKYEHSMSGERWPVPGKFIGEEQRRQTCSHSGDSVSLSSFQSARLVEPTGEVNGKAEYRSFYFSSYA